MLNSFLQFYICGLITCLNSSEEKLEDKLKNLGRDISEKIVLLKEFDRENDINLLMYKIAHYILPELFTTKRSVEVSENYKNVFFLYEIYSDFNEMIYNDLHLEHIVIGVIEGVLEFSGFKASVLVYSNMGQSKKCNAIYEIKICE